MCVSSRNIAPASQTEVHLFFLLPYFHSVSVAIQTVSIFPSISRLNTKKSLSMEFNRKFYAYKTRKEQIKLNREIGKETFVYRHTINLEMNWMLSVEVEKPLQ